MRIKALSHKHVNRKDCFFRLNCSQVNDYLSLCFVKILWLLAIFLHYKWAKSNRGTSCTSKFQTLCFRLFPQFLITVVLKNSSHFPFNFFSAPVIDSCPDTLFVRWDTSQGSNEVAVSWVIARVCSQRSKLKTTLICKPHWFCVDLFEPGIQLWSLRPLLAHTTNMPR